ncbi:hypothetical protein MMC34_000315 [Xylographa carneopallida]|nr:hypothetical protein [Xylographa carneopallida]
MDHIAKSVGKRVFKEQAGKFYSSNDVRYQKIPVLDKRGNPTGKYTKGSKKPMPLGVPSKDLKIFKKVKRRAHWLDRAINICGFRLGVSAIFGLIPVMGDVVDWLMAYMVFLSCRSIEHGLEPSIQARMVSNLTIDALGGLVPVVGDLFDAWYKCNTMNVDLLEIQLYRYYDPETVAESSKSSKKTRNWHNVGGIISDKPTRTANDGVVVNEQPIRNTNITYPDHHEDHEISAPPRYANLQDIEKSLPLDGAARPEPAHLDTKNARNGGWLSRFTNKREQPDLEMGGRLPDQSSRADDRPDGMF